MHLAATTIALIFAIKQAGIAKNVVLAFGDNYVNRVAMPSVQMDVTRTLVSVFFSIAVLVWVMSATQTLANVLMDALKTLSVINAMPVAQAIMAKGVQKSVPPAVDQLSVK